MVHLTTILGFTSLSKNSNYAGVAYVEKQGFCKSQTAGSTPCHWL
jgi:hypothetical protein